MVEEPRVEMSVCMGSSCFARGNRAIVLALQEAVAREGLGGRVRLCGTRCAGHCRRGPNITVDGVVHHEVDAGTVLDLLHAAVGGR